MEKYWTRIMKNVHSNFIRILKRIYCTINAEQYQRNILVDSNIIGECLAFPQNLITQEFLQMKNVDVLS